MTLDRRVIAQINRAAHAECRAQYAAIRAALVIELERAQAAGASPEQLLKLLADRARQVPARATEAR